MIVSLLLCALLVLGLYVGSHRLSGLQTAVVAVVASGGFLLVIFPTLSSATARFLGVGRGTDLLLYVSIVGGLFVAAHLYFRTKQQERQIVELTRALAIQRAWPSGAADGRNST